jgi:adenylyltransferase/sulfurtransferase
VDDALLTRYSRHILLPQIDYAGQERLLASRALIVGVGGLGSPAAMYLAASGVGHITLCDDDAVDLANLQRQIAHRSDDLGRPKVESARDTLAAINPTLQIATLARRLDQHELAQACAEADVVVDCSDNFATRFALNTASLATNTPLVCGAAIRFEGQVTTLDPRRDDGPCYRCLYPDEATTQPDTCSRNGVFAPLVGVIGAMQATEALKVLLDIGETLVGRLVIFNALSGALRTLPFSRDPQCPACGQRETAGVARPASHP